MPLSKTKIEWADYSINPVKGLCPMACKYCYARAMYHRFKWNPEIRFDEGILRDALYKTKSGDKIFIGSTIELFGEWVKFDWLKRIMDYVLMYPSRTFIFLTKRPDNMPHEFPDNCWIGVSTIGNDSRSGLEDIFRNIKAKVKFVSIEPLLDYTQMDYRWVDWVIIGAQTPYSQKTAPKTWWVEEITKTAKSEGCAVFHKDNLGMIFDANGFPKRQEYPCID